jgi:hypothetical protein
MTVVRERFVVDAKGRKIGVILSLRQYRKLLEDLHDPEETIGHEHDRS